MPRLDSRAALLGLGLIAAGCGGDPPGNPIKHVVIIMQQGRSFDSYFGTYPGADGIPMQDGTPSVCAPDPVSGRCVAPFHDARDVNQGGPFTPADATAVIAGGRMDGFVRQARAQRQKLCAKAPNQACLDAGGLDVMGYHDARELPAYWRYAQTYTLQDRLFQPSASWSLIGAIFGIAQPTVTCRTQQLTSCQLTLPAAGAQGADAGVSGSTTWSSLPALLRLAKVSWALYVPDGVGLDCKPGQGCSLLSQTASTAASTTTQPSTAATGGGGWLPTPQVGPIFAEAGASLTVTSRFLEAAAKGTLPAVSWIIPSLAQSERAPSAVSAGQAHVTQLINAVMQGPSPESTLILVTWSDYGGFYDHVLPPRVGKDRLGLRVPGLIISAYARQGAIDHQTLTFDAYLRLIERLFLDGHELGLLAGTRDAGVSGEAGAGGPDAGGDLLKALDLSQPPRPPLVLPVPPAP